MFCDHIFPRPRILHIGQAVGVEQTMEWLGQGGFHGCRDVPEGAVYRLESEHKFVTAAKYVRPDFVAGVHMNAFAWNKWNGNFKLQLNQGYGITDYDSYYNFISNNRGSGDGV
jgi:hypothetical protein